MRYHVVRVNGAGFLQWGMYWTLEEAKAKVANHIHDGARYMIDVVSETIDTFPEFVNIIGNDWERLRTLAKMKQDAGQELTTEEIKLLAEDEE